jgi:hypothetical protein
MRKDDLTVSHLQWLVDSRATNQKSQVRLYELLKLHHGEFSTGGRDTRDLAQALVAALFSLWRAVFLADRSGGTHAVFEDARQFLGKLILDNTVAYPQDRNARDWSFFYYVNNARYRLEAISREWPELLPIDKEENKNRSAKEHWTYYHLAIQSILDTIKAP